MAPLLVFEFEACGMIILSMLLKLQTDNTFSQNALGYALKAGHGVQLCILRSRHWFLPALQTCLRVG